MKHRVDHLKCLVDLFSNFRACQDNLAADENQEYNLRLDHTIDKTRKQLRLIRAEIVMARSQTLKTNGKLDIARSNDILDLEIRELCIESKLLYDSSILSRCKLRVVLGLGSSDHHLARGEDQRSCLWLTDTHDDGSETLEGLAR